MSAPVDELLPRARQLVDEGGALPSERRVKRELRVGVDKAKEILRKLATEPVPASTREHGEDTEDAPDDTAPEPAITVPAPDVPPQVTPRPARVPAWPVLLLALPAFVAIWSGWVGLGKLTGFGVVHPLPGIADRVRLDTAITLPIGVEAYAAYALRAWLTGAPVPDRARRFARASAVGALALGAAGQVAYHLLAAAGVTQAPWQITTAVACLPVVVLGMGAALTHLLHTPETTVPDPGR